MTLLQDILKVADTTLGRTICWLCGSRTIAAARSGGMTPEPPKKILVIRPGGIGDAVLVVPMLRSLRHEWPSARLDLLLERRNVGVLEETGLADRIFLYGNLSNLLHVLRGRYDLVVDTEQYHRLSAVISWLCGAPRRVGFGSNDRRRMLTEPVPYSQSVYEVYAFLELARMATGRPQQFEPENPFFPVSAAAAAFADDVLSPLGESRMIAIHPGASIPERRWHVERYAELARMLADDGHAIILLGGPADKTAAAAICRSISGFAHANLAGKCNLMQAAAVVAQASVYVSADSGILHLAYGVGTPTVHLFGPGVLSKWGPPGSRFRTVENPVPCSPCTRYGYTPPCCQGLVCMKGITPATVYCAVRAQLEAGPGRPTVEEATPC